MKTITLISLFSSGFLLFGGQSQCVGQPTPPSFTSGSNGTTGNYPAGPGTDGGAQPTPQTATLSQNGTYNGMDCGQGGNGGPGGQGQQGSSETAGGAGGKGGNGKSGAAITIYYSANVTLNGGHGPNGGNGGDGGTGGDGNPPGSGGGGGAPGTKGTIAFVPVDGGTFTQGSFANPADGNSGHTGATGKRL